MAATSPPAWKTFTAEQYHDAIQRLVHFSTKTVNSNATPAGIRLGPERFRSLPYLCASALDPGRYPLPLDYLTNAGPTATIAKQASQALEDPPPEAAPTQDVAAIRNALREALRHHFEDNTESVSPRVRQLLLPCPKRGYVAITPLTSHSLTALVHEHAQAHNACLREQQEKDKQQTTESDAPVEASRYLRFAYLGFGGDNAQNIGRLASLGRIQSPLFISAPPSRALPRRIAAYLYSGVPLLRHALMLELRQSLLPIQNRHHGSLPDNHRTKLLVDALAFRLIADLLARVDTARRHLLDFREMADDTHDLDDVFPELAKLANVQRGLLLPRLRDAAWRRSTAQALLHAIDHYRFADEITVGRLSFDRGWKRHLQNFFEESLL